MATSDERILIIIPAHDEEGRVGAVIRGAKSVLPQAEIVVIDDHSQDGTAREALEAGAVVLKHAINLGYGAGLETGYLYAVSKGYECVLQMDGDGQHLPEELPVLLGPVVAGDADVVIGSRHLGGGCGYETTFMRRLGQRLSGGIVRLLTGMELTDVTSGFQCLSKRTIDFFLSGIFPTDFPDADVVLMAHFAGLRVREVPVKMVSRTEGASMHSNLRPIYYGMKMILSIFIVLMSYGRWRKHVS